MAPLSGVEYYIIGTNASFGSEVFGMRIRGIVVNLFALSMLVVPAEAQEPTEDPKLVLVLSGVSTGVTAPFFATHLGANINRVLKLVMFTSLLVPFTLPALVSWLIGGEVNISAVEQASP